MKLNINVRGIRESRREIIRGLRFIGKLAAKTPKIFLTKCRVDQEILNTRAGLKIIGTGIRWDLQRQGLLK